MNKELCNHFRQKLADLPFADVLAGMAQTVQVVQEGPEGAKVTHRMPVAYDTNDAGNVCAVTPERDLVPNSMKKSIIYFEDFGLAPQPSTRQQLIIQSRVRLVCWLNRARLVGDHYQEITARCMGEIMTRLNTVNPDNVVPFLRLQTRIGSIPPQDAALFGRYTYDENVRQYLRPPFEFFGLDIVSTFQIAPNCLNEIEWDTQSCY